MRATMQSPNLPAEERHTTQWLSGSLVVLLACCVLFALFPDLDIACENFLYDGAHHRFLGADSIWLNPIRYGFMTLFVVACSGVVLGLLVTRGARRTWYGLGQPQWLFLAVCLAMGPGVVTNLALKDQWGRARPSQIFEYGGTKSFSPPLRFSDQCDRNCSFVCGEASSVFMLFFAGAFAFRRGAVTLALVGSALGLADGFVRMAQGAHFLSDVIFAGVGMAVTAAFLHLLFELVAAGGRNEMYFCSSAHGRRYE